MSFPRGKVASPLRSAGGLHHNTKTELPTTTGGGWSVPGHRASGKDLCACSITNKQYWTASAVLCATLKLQIFLSHLVASPLLFRLISFVASCLVFSSFRLVLFRFFLSCLVSFSCSLVSLYFVCRFVPSNLILSHLLSSRFDSFPFVSFRAISSHLVSSRLMSGLVSPY